MSEALQILVIDDNDFIRMQITKFLQDDGYKVHQAANVADAFDIVKSNREKLSCMLVDVRMEPLDGFNFLNKVQAENINIPAILVTGDQNSDILGKAGKHGVHSVLLKPVDKDKLLKMVARTIPGANNT